MSISPDEPLTTAAVSFHTPPLEIIAQPCYSSKLRYRKDYDRNRSRRGDLRSRNNPNYRSPAVVIPPEYRNSSKQYYIRICLITVLHDGTNRRYIHPYVLEDSRDDTHNEKQSQAVWLPIDKNGMDVVKSFPNLRVVKKTGRELERYGGLRVFDSPDEPLVSQLSRAKDTIHEFQLERSQLALTLGQKLVNNGLESYIPFTVTTILSNELVEILGRATESDMASEATATGGSHPSLPSACQVNKYAPRCGYSNANDEVLVFFTNKLETRKYGALEITFEYDTIGVHWSEPVLDLEVKEQMASFLTPAFPFPIVDRTSVRVVLKQKKRDFDQLTFDYLAPAVCSRCSQTLDPPAPTTVIDADFFGYPTSSFFDDSTALSSSHRSTSGK